MIDEESIEIEIGKIGDRHSGERLENGIPVDAVTGHSLFLFEEIV